MLTKSSFYAPYFAFPCIRVQGIHRTTVPASRRRLFDYTRGLNLLTLWEREGDLRHVRQVLDLPTPGRLLFVPGLANSGGPNANSTGDTDKPASEQPGRRKQ